MVVEPVVKRLPSLRLDPAPTIGMRSRNNAEPEPIAPECIREPVPEPVKDPMQEAVTPPTDLKI